MMKAEREEGVMISRVRLVVTHGGWIVIVHIYRNPVRERCISSSEIQCQCLIKRD